MFILRLPSHTGRPLMSVSELVGRVHSGVLAVTGSYIMCNKTTMCLYSHEKAGVLWLLAKPISVNSVATFHRWMSKTTSMCMVKIQRVPVQKHCLADHLQHRLRNTSSRTCLSGNGAPTAHRFVFETKRTEDRTIPVTPRFPQPVLTSISWKMPKMREQQR